MKLNLGENLRRLRRASSMTQEQLAEQLGVSFQSVSRWENGSTYPDMELLPALAALFSVTVDALLGMSDEERRKNFDAAADRLRQALFAEEQDEETIVRLLREMRRDFMDFFCGDAYYFHDISRSGAYRFPAVMEEMRRITNDVLRRSDSNFVKSIFIEQMAEMEDEEHIDAFLRQNATAEDLSGNALLRRRYLYRKEYDKLEKLRQVHLYELLEELCNERSTWGIRDRKAYPAEYCKYVNDACLNVLHAVCGVTPEPKHPVTGDGSLDLFADIRLNLGAKRVAACAGTGDIEEALCAMEDWVSLFEQVMTAPEGTRLGCRSPAMDVFSPKMTGYWMPIRGKEERFCYLNDDGAYEFERYDDGKYYGLFDPSGYASYFAEDFGGFEWIDPRMLDSIREHPRYQAALERLYALIEVRETKA
ncbi:MAG: helix-turn-helix domain-containing protein [Eubacteriales bacterium]